MIGHDFDGFEFFPAASVLAVFVLVPDRQPSFRIAPIAALPLKLVVSQLPRVVSQQLLVDWMPAAALASRCVFFFLALVAFQLSVVVFLQVLVAFVRVLCAEQASQLLIDVVSPDDSSAADEETSASEDDEDDDEVEMSAN